MDAGLARVVHELAAALRAPPGPGLALYHEAKGLELLSLLLMHWNDHRTRPRRPLDQRDRERLCEARDRLVHDPADPPSIDELARAAGMGQTRFAKVFRPSSANRFTSTCASAGSRPRAC
ncbi:MAG: hypothetical protein PHQ14_12025 [Chromatiales bacterium]|jgi:hypothetical protein|nr:hypothetical protein [Chromatiales bacterium]MDX9768593.1 hypothetical protein [Ectothiorhodospiraceae bacterium]